MKLYQMWLSLKDTKPGKGGEIQLTDARKELALKEDMYAYDFI